MDDDRATLAADWQAVEDAAAGDASARAEFSRRYRDTVRTWLWFRWSHTPLRSLVDDAVQEVFLECLRPGGALEHLDPTRTPRAVPAFLRGVARNVAHRIERVEARNFDHQRRLAAGAGAPAPARLGSAEQLDRAWACDRVATALDLLDREDRRSHDLHAHSLRDFLRLHFEEGLPVHVIAEQWDEQPEHVHEIRRRACRRFRTCLLRVMHPDVAVGQADRAVTDAATGREVLALLQ